MRVVKLNEAEFRDSLLSLRRRGGALQKAAEEAARMITHLELGIPEGHQVTNHGESRIKHCVKYDLPGACRLVTVQNEGVIYILFVGDHESVDRWLDRHEGLTLSCDRQTLRVKVVHVNRVVHEWKQPPSAHVTEENIPFFKRLPDFDLEAFIPEAALQKQVLRLNENSSDDDVQEAFDLISLKHPEKALVLFEMLFELKRGDSEAAEMRLKLFLGDAVPLSENPELEVRAIEDEVNSDQLIVLNELSLGRRAQLLDDDFQKWMFFLHSDQEKVAEGDFKKPVVLTGVSGSGKTCILIHRARYLALKYPNERIGILTLNRGLAHLLKNLVEQLCVDGEARNIHVLAFYDYFRELLHELGPDKYLDQLAKLVPESSPLLSVLGNVDRKNLANEVDARSGETLEDTWNDFFDTKTPDISSLLGGVVKDLEDYRIDASRYLREEFTLIRSAYSIAGRATAYPTDSRPGRAIPLRQNQRADVLRLLLGYEEYMLAGGMLDVLGLTQALVPLWQEIRRLPAIRRFRCLLIDEFQDFSNLDLNLLHHVPTSTENGLFLAGDPVQKVLVKRLRLHEAGLAKGNYEAVQIKKNYRNSREILRAASKLANRYAEAAKSLGEEIEILDPELALREATRPIALRTNNQIKKAWELAKQCMNDGRTQAWTICIATAAPEFISPESLLWHAPPEIPTEILSGDYIKRPDTMVVGVLQELKGFEFNLVIIVGCEDRKFPAFGVHEAEIWRDALRLYVSMTRARDQVYLLFEGEPSCFVKDMEPEIQLRQENLLLDYETKGEMMLAAETRAQRTRRQAEGERVPQGREQWEKWLSKASIGLLKLYFRTRVRPHYGMTKDFRGLSRRAVVDMLEEQEAEFRTWLTAKNLRKLRAREFFKFRNVGRARLQALEAELRAHGVDGLFR